MDNRKIILAFYVTASAVLGFLIRASIQYFYLTFYQFRRLPGIAITREAVPIVVAFLCFFILLRHAKANALMEDVVSELKKVTWPGREEVVRSTIVVMICIVICSLILGAFDVVWGRGIGWALKAKFFWE